MGNRQSCGCDTQNQVDNSHEITTSDDAQDEGTTGEYLASSNFGTKKTVEFDVPSDAQGRLIDSDFSGSYIENALHAVRNSDAARTSTEGCIQSHPRDTFEPTELKEGAIGKSYTANFISKTSVNIEEDMKTLQAFLEEHNFKNVNHNRSNEKKCLPCCGEPIGSPLHKAVEADNMELIRILLERGASLSAVDSRKKTPRAIAIRRKLNPELIKRLTPDTERSPFLKKKSP